MADPEDREGPTPPAKKTPAKRAPAKKAPAKKAATKKTPVKQAPARKAPPVPVSPSPQAAPVPAERVTNVPAKDDSFGRGHAIPISLALAGAGLAGLVLGRLWRN